LLSGGSFPEALAPVARTLDALRVGPMPAELADEAAARAAFRNIMSSGEAGSTWSAGSVSGADDSRTRILPAGPAAAGPRPAGRHRRQRPRRGRWQAKAVIGAAAAVVVVGGIALASTLSGSGSRPSQAGGSPHATFSTARAPAQGSRVEGSGTQEPSPKPTPTATSHPAAGAGTGPAELCTQYFAFFRHKQSASSWSAEQQRGQQLSSLAHGPMYVTSYCMHLLEPWAVQQAPENAANAPGPGSPAFGDQPGSHGSQGSQGENWPGSGGGGSNGSNGNAGRNAPGLSGRAR
jgi:hypothetical protein